MGRRCLIYSDLQATDGHERCRKNANMPLQIYRVTKFYKDLWTIYQQYRCSMLWDLGDTLDDRSAIPIPALDAVKSGLDQFPENEHNLKLVGNHEQYLRDTSISAGKLFSPKFAVVERTEAFELDDRTVVVMASFPASDAALTTWLDEAAYKHRGYARRILLGHFQVVGCQLNSGQALLGIPRMTIEKFDLALLGHVHKPQKVGLNAFYIGSPFQQNFGERNEAKRVGVLDLDTLKIEWVALNGYPEYHVLEFADWAKRVTQGEEHRYQVVLHTAEDAEKFYKHPLMSYAEPVYSYTTPEAATAENKATTAWTLDAVLSRWTETNDPKNSGIELPLSDVLDIGKALACNGSA